MSAEVSVVIAAYNVETYVARAIRSALDQADVTVEVIVVNDASSDGTASAISQIADSRLRNINLPSNIGPGAARNAGFEAATAPWISILDGDDRLETNRYHQCLKRARGKGADIIVDNILVCPEGGIKPYPMFSPAWFDRQEVIDLPTYIAGNSNFLGGSSLGYLKPIFSSSFLKKHKLRYDPALRIGEDYLFMADALAYGAKCVVEKSHGYNYTVRAGSTSHRMSLHDVTRISEGDKKFLSRHKLVSTAAKAQNKREARLKVAYAFTQLIDALKRRALMEAMQIALTQPVVLLYAWRPVWARLRRLA